MCAVISITYGFIDYDAYDHLTIEDGMKRIRNILNEEKSCLDVWWQNRIFE